MKLQRFLIALTIVNLGLLVFLLAQVEVRFLGFRFLFRSAEVNSAGSVLRGRALEITDDEGEFEQASRCTWHPSCRTARPTRKPCCFAWSARKGGPT